MVTNYEKLLQKFEDEIEYEYSIRLEELSKYENYIELATDDENEKDIYRKMLVVMIYSYFEGFCKKALLIYIDYINKLHLSTSEVTLGLAASSLEQEFNLLEKTNHNPIGLKGDLIDNDSKLHKYSRRKEFMSNYDKCFSKQVHISDATIDTESNLKSYVLKSLLYKLDIDYTTVDPYQNTINELLGKRNSIAHGDIVRGIDTLKYNDYKSKTINLMDGIKSIIINSYKDKSFLKQ